LPIAERRVRRRGKEAKRTYQKARLRPPLKTPETGGSN
jgi:hypothetical protein